MFIIYSFSVRKLAELQYLFYLFKKNCVYLLSKLRRIKTKTVFYEKNLKLSRKANNAMNIYH